MLSFVSHDRRYMVCYDSRCPGAFDPARCQVQAAATPGERTPSVRVEAPEEILPESLAADPDYDDALSQQPDEGFTPGKLELHEVPQWDKPQDWEGWLAGEAALQVVAAGGAQ